MCPELKLKLLKSSLLPLHSSEKVGEGVPLLPPAGDMSAFREGGPGDGSWRLRNFSSIVVVAVIINITIIVVVIFDPKR
jgi:hypothetical protein